MPRLKSPKNGNSAFDNERIGKQRLYSSSSSFFYLRDAMANAFGRINDKDPGAAGENEKYCSRECGKEEKKRKSKKVFPLLY